MAPLTEKDWQAIHEEWDDTHPSEYEDDYPDPEIDAEYSEEAMELVPQIPTEDGVPEIVEYSIRADGDFVRSGPLTGGDGPGVEFDSQMNAYHAMCIRYGTARVSAWDSGSEARWAFLIKKA